MSNEQRKDTDLPISCLVLGNYNPRKFVSEITISELAESIKQVGVVQPIVVRPLDNGSYEIIAGQRRYKATMLANIDHIPVVIKDVDDKTAKIIASIENSQRENIGPAEEALLARDMIDMHDGNKGEAIRVLGWTEKKFDARIMLLNACDEVTEALIKRNILLGHAELLANLPENTQRGTLKKIIDDNVTVDDLKKKLDAYALDLSKAYFDTTACATCPKNTTSQGSLFETHIGDGRCLDVECWNEKRMSALLDRKVELAETYNITYFDSEKAPENHESVIKAEVGAEQMTACRGCANFGASINTKPGSEGEVTKDQCFNLTCLKEKIAANKPASTDNNSQNDSAASTGSNGKKKAKKTTTASTSTSASASATPKKVIAYRDNLYRGIAAAHVQSDPHIMNVIALASLIKECGTTATIKVACHESEIDEIKAHDSIDAIIAVLASKDDMVLDKLRNALITSWLKEGDNNHQVQSSKVLIKHGEYRLEDHFVVDKAFLQTLTKNGILEILKESGFESWFINKGKDEKAGKKSYKALLSKKVSEIIDDVIDAEYDFKGYLPASIKLT